MPIGKLKRTVRPPSALPPARRPSDGSAVPLNETLAATPDGAPTARRALLDPLRVFGAKATAISQLAPGCSVVPQPFDGDQEVGRVGARERRRQRGGWSPPWLPSLRTVNVCVALTASTSVLANVAVLGFTDSPLPPAAPPAPA